MPMSLTVTRNRKTSQNYNSEGHGISLTVELDQSLLQRPEELQDQITRLYQEADVALDQQAGGHDEPRDRHGRQDDSSPRSRSNGNGRHGNGRSNQRGHGAAMTDSQRKAIEAISRRLDLDPVEEAHHEFGFNLDRMTVREASQLIDHLKSLQTSGNNSQGDPR